VTAVPPEILLAAREAVAAEAIYRLDAVPAGQIMRIAVEAAAPLITAAERDRMLARLAARADLGDDLARLVAGIIREQT
jgi:hypothetical protein